RRAATSRAAPSASVSPSTCLRSERPRITPFAPACATIGAETSPVWAPSSWALQFWAETNSGRTPAARTRPSQRTGRAAPASAVLAVGDQRPNTCSAPAPEPDHGRRDADLCSARELPRQLRGRLRERRGLFGARVHLPVSDDERQSHGFSS